MSPHHLSVMSVKVRRLSDSQSTLFVWSWGTMSVLHFSVSASAFRTRVLRRPSCSMWSVRFTLQQTAVQWTCRHMNCAVTWLMWSLTSPASMGKPRSTNHYTTTISETFGMWQNVEHWCVTPQEISGSSGDTFLCNTIRDVNLVVGVTDL